MKFKIFVFVLSISITVCYSQRNMPINNGVYVSKTLIENRKLGDDSIYPILAFRIDNIISDTLLVKYRFGFDFVNNVDFIYIDSCSCYMSIDKVFFAPLGRNHEVGRDKEKLFMKVISQNEVILFFYKNEEIKEFLYKFTYKDTVDLTTHRNVYYAEDGFKLFPD